MKSTWRKEHREHPWTTIAQAKRIASDHALLEKMKKKGKGSSLRLTKGVKRALSYNGGII